MPKRIHKELTKIKYSDGETVGQRITEIRKVRGYTQVELAEKIGIARDLLSSYELGRVRIYDEMIYRLALILEVSTDRLLGFEKREEVAESVSLRYTRRIKQIETLPEHKIRMILKMIDDSIKANKE
ncbi:MAG: helix-turn-helix domain-containing protein [Spirochaetaceae bacterium]